jgi:AsmA protein
MKPGQLPWKWLLFGLLAVLLFCISLIPWLIGDTSRFGDRVAERLSAWTGGKAKFTGPVQVSFLPDMSVRGPLQLSGGENLPLVKSMTVKEAKVSLDLVDLLRGQISIDVLRLQKPRIKLKDGVEAKNATKSFLADLLAGVPVRVLHLRNGRIDLGLHPIKDFYLRLDAGEETGALSGTGSFAFKGETVRYAVTSGSPAGTGNDESTPVMLSLDSPLGAVKIAGTAAFAEAYRLDGKLQAESGNLRNFLNWVGFELPPGDSLEDFSAAGAVHLAGGILSVDNGSFSLDGNKAVGVLALSASPRPRIDGTFALDRLSLNPYLGNNAVPGAALFDHALLRYVDADLRISGGEIKVGPFNLGRGGFTITAKNGSVTTEVGELELCGGSAEGRIGVELAPPEKELSLNATLTDIAMEPCLKPLGLKLTGTGALKAELTSKGNTLPEITRSLGGTFMLKAQNGTLPLDLAQLSSTPMPLEANGWSWNGGSSYEKLEANCRLRSGRILCKSLNIEMPRETVVGAGDVDLRRQTLNWNLSMVKLGAPAQVVPPSGNEPKLLIRGTLRQPSIQRTDGPTAGAGSLSTGATNKQAAPH